FQIVTHLRWEFFVPKADPPPIPEMKGMLTCGAAIHCIAAPQHTSGSAGNHQFRSFRSFPKACGSDDSSTIATFHGFCGQLPIALMAIQDCPAGTIHPYHVLVASLLFIHRPIAS
ncbi:hypothetical protein, partial [Bifidobacterium sp.]|uniref:hypothetical protein n=1 Tax=Bifidobacterium sp. TaxID=41200 RepID=UPI003D7E8A15